MEAVTDISRLFPTTADPAAGRQPGELGQEDFMRLMVAQLKNQDPTKPMDNFEFLSQIAQFGTVDGIQGLQSGFGDLASVLYANQALEAASLVGQQVMTESNLGVLGAEGTLDATIALPSPSSSVTLYIQDVSGRLVHSQPLGAAAAGELKVEWDGTNSEGVLFPPGQYRISAEAVVSGAASAVSVYAHSLVESVTIDRAGSGVMLNLAGGDRVSLSEVNSFL